MSYINSDGNNYAIGTAYIKLQGSKKIERTEWGKTTTYYYPSGQFIIEGDIHFGYDIETERYYVTYDIGEGIEHIYSTSGNFKVVVKGNSNYKELITPTTADGSHGDTDFRTKLHCDLPKSNCGVSYVASNDYNYYVNDTLVATSNLFTISGFQVSVTPQSKYESGSFTPGTSGSSYWSITGNCSNWGFEKHTCKLKDSSNKELYLNVSGNSMEAKGYMERFNLDIGRNGMRNCQYHYEIDGINLNNTNELQFQADGVTWTGLTSPDFSSDLDGWSMFIQGNNLTTIFATPQFDTDQIYMKEWRVSAYSSLPTTIGNVTCLNPEKINNYTQSESGEEEEPQEVRNNIFKIMPKFNSYGSGLLSMQSQTITNNNWQYHNCELQNGKVVATGENAYIYQDYTRGKYTNEIDPTNILGGDQYKEYRQRHFTHFRYMESTFQKTEGGQSDFYNPDIKLIYKPISDYTSGHTWTAKFNSAIGYYDLLDCNLANTSSQDELTNLIEPEYMYLAFEGATEEPEKNVTFIVEQPLTAFGYLPNVVGQIQIPIPQNCEVTLGTLSSYYAPNLSQVSEPVDSLGAWESLDHLIEYTDGGQDFTAKPSGKLYIHSYTEPTFTINDVNVTNNWTTLNNGTNVNVVMVHEGVTSTVSKTFSENVIIKFKTYHIDNDPYPDEYGIEWYFIKKDNDEEYEEVDGIWYRKRYKDTGYNIMVGSEFQEPLHFGLHQPKPRDTQSESDVTRDLYQNRFLVVDINGARSFEIPEVRKDVLHGSYSDQISFHPVTLGQCKTNYNNPGDRFVFFRDDLNEITLSVYDSSPINNNYPINDMFFGSDAYINWLQVFESKIEVQGGTNYWHKNIKIVPRFDTLSGSELYRFINNGNTTLKCRGDFGAYFSGTNKVDTTGNIVDNSEYDNDVSLNFDTHKYYTSHFHGTDAEINLCSNVKKRTIEKVVDCVKYWWSVGISVGIGFIWRNSQGNILRNSQNKILRGHGYDNNP